MRAGMDMKKASVHVDAQGPLAASFANGNKHAGGGVRRLGADRYPSRPKTVEP
jgi:hypothetical protein